MKYIFLIIISFVVLGCSSTAKINQKMALEDLQKTSHDLYAHLEYVDGEYLFTEFTTGTPDYNKEAWVNLKTGKVYWNIESVRCGIGFIKDPSDFEIVHCDHVIREHLFMEPVRASGDVTYRAILAPFTWGAALSGATYNIEFNSQKYFLAYEAAFKKISTEKLNDLFKILRRTEDFHQKIKQEYDNSIKTADLEIKIIDRSGLYENSIDFDNIIYLEKNVLSGITSQLEKSVELLRNQALLEESRLKAKWADETNVLDVVCPESTFIRSNFTISTECPDRIVKSEGAFRSRAVTTIHSRSFDDVYPRKYFLEDEKISLDFHNNQILISNKSLDFVSIHNISFYYNGQISNIDDLDLNLSPNSRQLENNTLKLNQFRIDESAVNFEGITKEKAENTVLEYGFALRYRVASDDRDRTLYGVEKYTLKDLIEDHQ